LNYEFFSCLFESVFLLLKRFKLIHLLSITKVNLPSKKELPMFSSTDTRVMIDPDQLDILQYRNYMALSDNFFLAFPEIPNERCN